VLRVLFLLWSPLSSFEKQVCSSLMPSRKKSKKLRECRRSSVCQTSLMNLGSDNPRLVVVRQPGVGRSSPVRLPRKRKARTLVPSHLQVMTMIRKCFPLDSIGLCHRDAFVLAFEDAVKMGKVHGEPRVCATPLRWIAHALSKSYAGLPGVVADDVHGMTALGEGGGSFLHAA
jgi:hypothetical protein